MEETNSKKPKTSPAIKVLGVAVAALGLAVAIQWVQISKLSSKSPAVADSVVVVDFMQMALLNKPGTSEEEIEKSLVQVRNNIRDLGEAGFIVLDSTAVLSAPSDAYLHELVGE